MSHLVALKTRGRSNPRGCGGTNRSERWQNVMQFRAIPENIRSNHGTEFATKELRQWLAKL